MLMVKLGCSILEYIKKIMNIDEQIDKLMQKVAQKKSEIAKAERPKWKTHLSFTYNNTSVNIGTVTDKEKLIQMMATLICEKTFFDLAKKELEVSDQFAWQNFSFDDWKDDIKTRLSVLEISRKKKELTTLETKLNSLVSPEQRRLKEIQEIERLLEN